VKWDHCDHWVSVDAWVEQDVTKKIKTFFKNFLKLLHLEVRKNKTCLLIDFVTVLSCPTKHNMTNHLFPTLACPFLARRLTAAWHGHRYLNRWQKEHFAHHDKKYVWELFKRFECSFWWFWVTCRIFTHPSSGIDTSALRRWSLAPFWPSLLP
jgi:hypothetical protein